MNKWIDVTQPLKNGMVFWPGQLAPDFELISDMDEGDMANVTKMELSAHTGTHMDAPAHFLNGAKDISQMPPEAGVGKVRVMHHTGENHINVEDLKAYESRTSEIKKGERIFFKTKHSKENWVDEEFKTDYISLAAEGAEYLAQKNIQLVGIDYLSIAPFSDLPTPHNFLLEKEVWIVEGLRLTEIEEGEYEVICLPLKIEGADGSPARVLMRAQ